jgi:hypothetical protein
MLAGSVHQPSANDLRRTLEANGATVKDRCLYRVLLGDKEATFQHEKDFGVTIEDAWKGGIEKLNLLRKQPYLKEINFGNAPDEWLSILDDAHQIEGIYFFGRRTTDVGLQRLKNHKNLVAISLSGTSITDKTLANLAHLKKLRYLNLALTKVTDAGLKHLNGLENLESINVEATEVTDNGLRELKGLKKLRKIRFPYGEVQEK